LDAAEHALALEPNDAETVALVAGIYSRSGSYAKAEAFATRALELRTGVLGSHSQCGSTSSFTTSTWRLFQLPVSGTEFLTHTV
jgi:hypothetical protein